MIVERTTRLRNDQGDYWTNSSTYSQAEHPTVVNVSTGTPAGLLGVVLKVQVRKRILYVHRGYIEYNYVNTVLRFEFQQRTPTWSPR